LYEKGGEKVKRAYISLKYPFLAINAKGGESISPKQKDRTTTNFKRFELRKDFSIWYLIFDRISNCKTLLNTKRRILLRGSFA
jgi:hypothetical protein